MRDEGLIALEDPAALLLGDRRPELAGSCVVPITEGRRTLLVEVQALVAATKAPMPRRSAQGIDNGRLAVLLAVLEKRVGFKFFEKDVYASAVGGVRVNEPAADLGHRDGAFRLRRRAFRSSRASWRAARSVSGARCVASRRWSGD